MDNFLNLGFTLNASISIAGLIILFAILISEKIEKAIISVLIAILLVILQVFQDPNGVLSSQEVAFEFIYKNLDIFAFIIGMMIISGIAKDSGVFKYIALFIAKKLKGSPIKLFFILSYLAFFFTIFISNIPTIIIMTPIVLLITKKLKLPILPYIIGIITFANLGGAVTPISDPTTYYQAKTLHLSFFEVVSNTGLIMLITTFSSGAYLYLIFRKDLHKHINLKKLEKIELNEYIKGKKEVIISVSILIIVILIILLKEKIKNSFGITLENGTITLFGAFLSMLFLSHNITKTLTKKVDFATLFFFAGLFIVVGALEYNGVIEKLADLLVEITNGSEKLLLFIITVGSALLSVFIDNVPYNIAMVSTLETFKTHSIIVGPAWTALAWGLNSCTSIGGAGSPIGSACNVIALGQAEKKGIFIGFLKYLKIGVPLVLINSLIAYGILYFRYLG